MPQQRKKDNQTYAYKKALRLQALSALAERGVEQPTVMETHGGNGMLYRACYRTLRGVVIEKDPKKIKRLALQRPTWAVYECDCETTLAEGLGGHVAAALLDCDPYGEPWRALEAFFASWRKFAPVMAVVVNDGLRQSLGLGTAHNVRSMHAMVEKYGNDLHPIYLEISEELIGIHAAQAGYRVEKFAGYYCGPSLLNTHWLALLRRDD